jgi:hypothetical protein
MIYLYRTTDNLYSGVSGSSSGSNKTNESKRK